jgi:hypothetical protein
LFPWIYTRDVNLPGPGSENIVFRSWQVPWQTPIGPGVANAHQMRMETQPTFAPHLIGVDGLGGLLFLPMTTSPLTDNPFSNG